MKKVILGLMVVAVSGCSTASIDKFNGGSLNLRSSIEFRPGYNIKPGKYDFISSQGGVNKYNLHSVKGNPSTLRGMEVFWFDSGAAKICVDHFNTQWCVKVKNLSHPR